jgi:glycosyltransferase involved in cell wall biosynthesis
LQASVGYGDLPRPAHHDRLAQAWGLAPLEAIASGTPVILTPGAGVYEILAGRPGIHVVPADDLAATAAAIRAVRSGDGRESVEPTRRWLRSELSMSAHAERMEAVYMSVSGMHMPSHELRSVPRES